MAGEGRIVLSKRLQAAASLITAGSRVVDIGTDHAYIPIYLMQENLAVSVIAMDVRTGPLERAKEHVSACGLEEKIELRLSDGFQKIRPFEVDAAVLAGMGGGLMIRILREHPKVVLSLKECILQPQSELARVRTFLLEEGFFFLREEMVKEDGKYYPMMKVAPPETGSIFNAEKHLQESVSLTGRREEPEKKKVSWNSAELHYGKLLLGMRHPVLKEYLEWEYGIRLHILQELKGQSGEHILKRRTEIEAEIENIRKGLSYYAV